MAIIEIRGGPVTRRWLKTKSKDELATMYLHALDVIERLEKAPPTPAACAVATPTEDEMRAEFQRQHDGRNLRQHYLRGTYLSAPIAALWNQHLRTIKWMQELQQKKGG